MGVLDFFFGRTKPTPTTTTTVQSSKLPEEIAPYVKQVLEEAKTQYDLAKERGYQAYPGETISPRTQEELDAIAGLRGLIGKQDKYITEAEQELRGIPTEFTAESAQKFMSPYQQAVTDIEKRKSQEDFQRRIMPEFEKQAVSAGGMSGLGSRAGVQAARLGQAQLQQLGDIQTRGSQKAYEDAYRQFTDQAARQRARASDLQGIGLTKFQTGLAEQGLGQKLAQADRAEAQSELDKSFKEYIEQEQYPESELAQLSSFVYGNPFLRTPDTTTTRTGMLQPTSSVGQGLLGLGLTGLNIYGRGLGAGGGPWTAANFGRSMAGKKYGGRVVQRQEGGEVPNVYSQGQQVAASPAQKGGLGSLFGSRGFLGGIFPRPRQTNVIENIDNAAGSLNSYKEAMDQNMKDLSRASQGIAQTYGQTFGQMQGRMAPYVQNILDRRRSLMEISDPIRQPQPSDVLEMKAGGGLGSLPVVKRQVGGGGLSVASFGGSGLGGSSAFNAPRPQMQTSPLSSIEQIMEKYPKFGRYISGEMANEQAERREKFRADQLKKLKEAMPQQDRFVGLTEAAKRVMGADPSKGFINALVQGMSGLDEVQREAYLKEKEQELKLLEIELKGQEEDLKATEAAEKEGATLPLKLAKMQKDLQSKAIKLDKPALDYMAQQAANKFGVGVTYDAAGNLTVGKEGEVVDPKTRTQIFNYLNESMDLFSRVLRQTNDVPRSLAALRSLQTPSAPPPGSGTGSPGSSGTPPSPGSNVAGIPRRPVPPTTTTTVP